MFVYKYCVATVVVDDRSYIVSSQILFEQINVKKIFERLIFFIDSVNLDIFWELKLYPIDIIWSTYKIFYSFFNKI